MAVRRSRISSGQKELLVDFMETHRDFVLGALTPTFTAATRTRLWEELTAGLNAEGFGGVKTVQGWKLSWKEMRKSVKEKAAKIKASIEKTGGGYAKSNPLTPLEERIAALIGSAPIHGLLNTRQTGCEALRDAGDMDAQLAGCNVPAPLFVNEEGFILNETGEAVHLTVPQQHSATGGPAVLPTLTIEPAVPITSPACRPRNKRRRVSPPLAQLEAATSSMDSLATAQKATTAALVRMAVIQEEMVELKRQKLLIDRQRAQTEQERAETEKKKIEAFHTFNTILKSFLESF